LAWRLRVILGRNLHANPKKVQTFSDFFPIIFFKNKNANKFFFLLLQKTQILNLLLSQLMSHNRWRMDAAMTRAGLFRYAKKGRHTAAIAGAAAGRALAIAKKRSQKYRQISHGWSSSRGTQNEFKSLDVTVTAGAADTTGTLTLLNGVAPGSDINQRVGRQIMMKSIQLNFTGIGNASNDSIIRFLVVWDKQCNAAALTIANLLTAASVNSTRNLDNRNRFVILADQRMPVNIAGVEGHYWQTTFYRKLRHPTTFNTGNAGTVADMTTGSIYLVVIGSNVAGATAGTFNSTSRIRFLD